MINILDKYLIKRFLSSFFFILMAILVIVVIVDVIEKLQDFLDKKPPLFAIVFEYYANLIPFFGALFAPICVFLAVILFTSQLAERTELVAALSGGVSFYRILATYMCVALFLAVLSFYFKGYVVPKATQRRMDFEYNYKIKNRVKSKDRDIHKKISRNNIYTYLTFYDFRRAEGFGFTIERFDKGDLKVKARAERLNYDSLRGEWVLKQASVRSIEGEKETLVKYPQIHEKELMKLISKTDTIFNLKPEDIVIREMRAESMNIGELSQFISDEEIRGSDILKDLYIERHRRYSDPVALLILTVIGYAMSSRKSRGGTALQIGLGVLISVVFIALLMLLPSFVNDSFPAWAAVWTPNLLFVPVAILLTRLAPK